MRTIQPEPGYTEADVKALLASKQFVFADCFSLIAPNNDTIRCASVQKDVIVTPIGGGVKQTWTAKGVKVSGLKTVCEVGVDVDEQEVQLDFLPTDMFQGLTLANALLWGRFDGGTLLRDRYFAQEFGVGNVPTAWMGGTRLYSGKIASIDELGRSYCKFKSRSQLTALDINVPSTLFLPQCRNALYDVRCKLNRDLYRADAVVGAGSTSSVIKWSGATADYALGSLYIVTVSGVTLIRTVRDVVVGDSLLLAYPLEIAPTVGQNFTVYQGCDRSFSRCRDHFNNQVNFRGYPFVPTEDTAL